MLLYQAYIIYWIGGIENTRSKCHDRENYVIEDSWSFEEIFNTSASKLGMLSNDGRTLSLPVCSQMHSVNPP